ncbi:URC4/urg3 family protein [Thalassomonas viridans]|uniref:URC4/urg3 family protein n=1 Tax=Thalassomonas viridans TaxID=137584 RepID=A0AAE9Z9Q5_9GAMM|nr:URC4/urg3 family protein [Thalassomonas viridans]WDE09138.1 URC4/urg3 family protein [Thalassomonas viridans]
MNIEEHTITRVEDLLSAAAIRSRCRQIYRLSQSGHGNFKINLERLNAVADYVLAEIRNNYPDLNIPFHSRWSHFNAGGIDRMKNLNARLQALSPIDRARAKIDLVLVSVLLDAGAGEHWQYREKESGQVFNRSEGLAIASLVMFLSGAFSSNNSNPFQADAKALTEFSREKLIDGFQISDTNPLTGIDGRVDLLRALGKTLNDNPSLFSHQRPGNLLDALISAHGECLSAEHILTLVLTGFGSIWPGRINIGDTCLGDVWEYPLLQTHAPLSALVPFHKLSQWLTYSLIEPITEAGIKVTGVEALTGLAEYRNGGLLLDLGLIELKYKSQAQLEHSPDSELIIEWRALTIVLLDEIAGKIREKLHLSAAELPLAKVLEGGTWHAGRKAAKALRPDGSPPLKLNSDGTVF